MGKKKRLAREKKALEAKKLQLIAAEKAYNARLIAETIDGVYIPKNLEECFIELDKSLKKSDIEAIKSLVTRDEVLPMLRSLGLSIRNSWGLWGGSRLQVYFKQKGVSFPDNMSAIIFEYYYDWLNGEHEEWRMF